MTTRQRMYRIPPTYATPDQTSARFLNPTERAEVQRRLRADHGHLSNDFDMKYVWQAIKDWKICTSLSSSSVSQNDH